MQWLIALGVFVAGLGLLVLAVRSSKKSPRPSGGGAIGAFASGFEEAFDRRGAIIVEETEKRLEMEGEEESGAPPLEKGSDE
jgi:hypothetical protein